LCLRSTIFLVLLCLFVIAHDRAHAYIWPLSLSLSLLLLHHCLPYVCSQPIVTLFRSVHASMSVLRPLFSLHIHTLTHSSLFPCPSINIQTHHTYHPVPHTCTQTYTRSPFFLIPNIRVVGSIQYRWHIHTHIASFVSLACIAYSVTVLVLLYCTFI